MPATLSAGYVWAALLILGVINVLLRLAPFLALARLKDSLLLRFLGRYLPTGVMVILVMYTLKDVTASPQSWIPAVIGLTGTVALHLWRRSAVLSVLGGTAMYVACASLLG